MPLGSAVLWVHPDYQHDIFPMVTSEKYDGTNFDVNFSYQGSNDNTQYYTAKTALKFHKDIGGHVSYQTAALSTHSTHFSLLTFCRVLFLKGRL